MHGLKSENCLAHPYFLPVCSNSVYLLHIMKNLSIVFTEQLKTISTSTGIVLDHTYTLKAVKGLLGELHGNPRRFQGKRILFVHTGMYEVSRP